MVHELNSGLVESLLACAVLPDFDNWANKYVVVTFDDNPTREYAPLSDSAAATQRHAAGAAFLAELATHNGRRFEQ